MSNQPFNVLPYVNQTDMLGAARKGLDMGALISKLPVTAHENAAQSAMASIAQEGAKDMQARIRQIQGDKSLSPQQKTAAIQQVMLGGGFGYTPSGGTIDPIGNALKSLQMNLDLKGRAGVVGGGTQVTDGTGNPPAPPRQPVTTTTQPTTSGDANSTTVVTAPQQNETVTGAARPQQQQTNADNGIDNLGYLGDESLISGYQRGGLVKAPIARAGEYGYPQPRPATFLRVPRPSNLGYAQPPPATFLRRK
jgi:hypothetical protein